MSSSLTTRATGRWRATPVPVGQAGRVPSRRHAEPAGRALPEGDPDPGGLRSQFTHVTDVGADDPRPRRHPPADPRRRDRAGAAPRVHVRRLALGRRRARAPHAAVLRGGRQPGDVQGRLVVRTAPAADPLGARPRRPPRLRPGLGSRHRSGRALLPPRRLLAGQKRGGAASREGRGAAEALLGGGGALPGAAAAGRAQLLLRHRAAAPEGVEVHLPQPHRERPRAG